MNSKIAFEVEYNDSRWREFENKALETVFNVILRSIPYKTNNKDFFVSIIFSNGKHVQYLNAQYRNKNKDTNVLSFQHNDWNEKLPDFVFLGEIILSYDKTLNEAEAFKKDFQEYVFELIIHGTLHLFGFDHIHDADANEMEDLEEKIKQRILQY